MISNVGLRFIVGKMFVLRLQVVTPHNSDEISEVIQRLCHLREGGPALDSRQAGSCLLLDTLDVFLNIDVTHLALTLNSSEGDLGISQSCDGILKIRHTFLQFYFSVVYASIPDSHLIAQHGHDGNIAGDGLAQGTQNLRRGAFLLAANTRLENVLHGELNIPTKYFSLTIN